MKIVGLKRLSKKEIEAISKKVLEHFKENYFSLSRPTRLNAIINNLVEKHVLSYSDTSPLGFTSDNSRILGCYIPDKRTILIDEALKSTPTKFNFVLGHELGHFALHRKLVFSECENDFIQDTERQIQTEKRHLETDLDFMEWQANYFAAVILLPSDILCDRLLKVRKELNIPWRGRIYVDSQTCNQKDYHSTLQSLSDYFCVSKTVVEIRLKEMMLVEDHRNDTDGRDPQSIAELMKTFPGTS